MSNLHVNKLTVGLRVTGGGVVPVLFCFFNLQMIFPWIPYLLSGCDGAESRDPRHRSSSDCDFRSPRCPLSWSWPEQFLGYILETMTLSNSLSQQCCLLCTVFVPPPATKVQSLQFPLQASCLIPIYKVRSNVLKALPSVTHPGLDHN